MDLFNTKKLAALRGELTIATAKLEATTKELVDLKKNVHSSYNELTDYFKPKYVNKYFIYKTDGSEIRIKVLDLKYDAGCIELTSQMQNGSVISILIFSVAALKNLTIITRKDFVSEEGDK